LTVIEMLENRIAQHSAALCRDLSVEDRANITGRIAEDRNLIFILTANKQISRVE